MADVSRLGRRLRYFRDLRGMTQDRLHETSGVSSAVIGGLESGLRQSVMVTTLEKLAKALGIGLDDLTGFSPFEDVDAESDLVPASA